MLEENHGWPVFARRVRTAWRAPRTAALASARELRARLIVGAPVSLRKAFYRKPGDWSRRSYYEKLQWRCLNPDPRIDYPAWVDKALSKDLVRPHFPVPETFDLVAGPEQIDTSRLPATYVMKATHGWNMSLLVLNGVIQGQNRSSTYVGEAADNVRLQEIARAWWRPGEDRSRNELHYRFLERRILFEQFLDSIDYELHCFLFHGEMAWVTVFKREFQHYRGMLHRVYDADWHRLEPGSEEAEGCYDHSPEETPRSSQYLLQFLRQLCRQIDHVRADFYLVGGEPYFNEFTFTHGAGGRGALDRYTADFGRFWKA